MFFSSWLNGSRRQPGSGQEGRRRTGRYRPVTFKPRLEQLETRLVPSTLPGPVATLMNQDIGGGGSLFAPSINPANGSDIYVSSDMSQVFHTTNGGQLYWFGWIGPGPEGQRPFDASQGALFPYLQGRGVEFCPSFQYFSSQLKLKAQGATYGYGYNLYLSAATREPMRVNASVAISSSP